ncbi:MAG: hypothetical protein KBD94_01715 [Pyrinomonadaceae bacterium]|nr:hypothetical protein [Pyrinomonadaceae bacterium]
MDELELVWSQMLTDAGEKAAGLGRHAVAEYLRLKATNDAIRSRGVTWLIDAFVSLAANEQARHSNLTITREEPHRFDRGTSRMVGSCVEVRLGVRCLSVAAGWARTPSDGIMRGGALAIARVTQFGMPKAGAEYRLVHGRDLPQWLDVAGMSIDSDTVRSHIDTFLGL